MFVYWIENVLRNFVVETSECVEMCGFNEIKPKTCSIMEKNILDKLMENPFDLPIFDQSLKDAKIKDIIEISILEQFSLELNINTKELTLAQIKDKYLTKGKIFSLPKSSNRYFHYINIPNPPFYYIFYIYSSLVNVMLTEVSDNNNNKCVYLIMLITVFIKVIKERIDNYIKAYFKS